MGAIVRSLSDQLGLLTWLTGTNGILRMATRARMFES